MTYVALKPMTLPGGEKRYPGELIPEAAAWPNIDAYAACGHLVFLPDGLEAEFGDLLRQGKSVVHLAPHVRVHHLMQARLQMRHGGGVDLPTSSPDLVPPPDAPLTLQDDGSVAPDLRQPAVPVAMAASQKLNAKLRGARPKK